jgi:hypothetical protein
MLNAFTKAFRAARQASDWREQQDKIEKACQEAKTTAHFDALLEYFEAREIGSHIADWADEAAYHPHESAGLAMVTLEGGAIVAEWNDQGFWDVSTMSEEQASKIIEEANAEWNQEEEEEEEEEEEA